MRVDVLGTLPRVVFSRRYDESRRDAARAWIPHIGGARPRFRVISPRSAPAAERFEAAVSGWLTDYPAPGIYISNVAAIRGSSVDTSCSPALDRKLHETLERQARNPQAANKAWARLDRELIDRAIIVPVITPKATDFVSKRVGNYQRHPVFGILISQLWVR